MNKQILAIGVIALAVGVGSGYWLAGESTESPRISAESKPEPLYYRHPMNASVTSPVPAKGSMGMDYVPVYAEDAIDAPAGTVRIDPVVVHNIGVRTAVATRQALSHTVRAMGRIDFDERRIARLHPKISGWIEELYIDTTGAPVRKDTMLLSVYSPRLVASQQEYVLALRHFETLKNSSAEDIRRGAEELVQSSRSRLELFDVPEHQIRELEETLVPQKYLHIHSPAVGIVMQIGARQGQYVTPATELYMIADLSRVWAYADIFEYELPWVKIGDQVEMTLAALPGKVFRGQLDYVYPYAETRTRTVKVRMAFENPNLDLKPKMFADVVIRTAAREQAIVIPSEAIVRSGVQDQVFIVREPGRFEPRGVKLGIESEGLVTVLEGLNEGDEVVTSAQFLIDSESKLREAAAKMTEIGEDVP
ncbi:MAG: efflux RND transporter periplasmic adaptor subunit [Gammaproteobacteria bacterium]|nr:efflux RND transporter periplasmic adaptor subunit [Gammaproteobacteria bacterium]